MSELGKLCGRAATGESERRALFEAALRALAAAEEGGFVVFGCAEHQDVFVQFSWQPPVMRGEVGGAPETPEVASAMIEKGFLPPIGNLPNYAAEFPEPDLELLAQFVEEIFRTTLRCAEGYTARLDDAEAL